MWQIPVRQKGTVAKPTAIFKPGPRSPSAKKNEDRPWTPTEAGSGTGLVTFKTSTYTIENAHRLRPRTADNYQFLVCLSHGSEYLNQLG